ncbi:MAG TPA: PIN domain-containing protein [Polyangia bacterium]
MILVDTSVWIDFLAGGSTAASLKSLLETVEVACHPFVRGELALGQLGRRRKDFLRGIDRLPVLPLAAHEDVLALVEAHDLVGAGIGWGDAHLLAACVGTKARLWTLDRSLRLAALRAREVSLLHPGR